MPTSASSTTTTDLTSISTPARRPLHLFLSATVLLLSLCSRTALALRGPASSRHRHHTAAAAASFAAAATAAFLPHQQRPWPSHRHRPLHRTDAAAHPALFIRALGGQRRRLPVLLMVSAPSSSSSSGPEGTRGVASTAASAKPIKRVYAYAHGFLSDEHSYKGTHFARIMAEEWGQRLHLLNLNGPSGKPEGITYGGGLEAIDSIYKQEGGAAANVQLTLFGSSLGGFLAARYAELYPHKVERLVLLCPGFDRCSRWEALFGAEALREWESVGWRAFEFKGQPIRVPYTFVTEAAEHPPFPHYRCPALIIHGLKDEVVPVEVSTTALLEALPQVKEHTAVLVVDDDHGLTQPATLKTAGKAIAEFLDLRGRNWPAAENAEADAASTTSSAASSRDQIEVEQKFPLAQNDPQARAALDAAILAQGGVLKGQVIMTDTYYDLPGNALSLANVWLRKRSGVWELKVPAVEGEHPNVHAVACYREVSGAEDTKRWLLQRFPEQLGRLAHQADLPLPDLLLATKAHELARYTTHRSKYSVPVEGGQEEVGIDVDEADYGFAVTEIEVCVPIVPEGEAAAAAVAAAKARVVGLARALGLLPPLGSNSEGLVIRGKLEEYIARRDPEHHSRLVDAGVFRRICRGGSDGEADRSIESGGSSYSK